LGKNNFIVERQLTVSHFRSGFLKKLLPAKFLAALDGLFQPSGAWFQLTPSVFLRARATGDAPQVARALFFKCLECGKGFPEFTGSIHCPGCGHVWLQKNGIYDFRQDH
jgi:DNA-directed RNA polymerase subunit RPC12/RpoP